MFICARYQRGQLFVMRRSFSWVGKHNNNKI